MAQDTLSSSEQLELLKTLKTRFDKYPHRHEGINWNAIVSKLEHSPDKLWTLHEMEQTGGEPDVIGHDPSSDEYVFCDCAKESPSGRRSLCFDREALESRKEHKPENNVLDLAQEIGITLLTEEEYRNLQQLEAFDLKTSSWIQTPDNIRKLGGALFGDRRYDQVFTYHNGASSYYAARGFRGILKV